jgi:primary-amine oxidase
MVPTFCDLRRCRVLLVVMLVMTTPSLAQPPGTGHPLDALTADEIRAATRALTAAPQFPPGAKYSTIVLKEPPKSEVLAFTPGATVRREAFAIVLDRRGNRTFEAVVDLHAGRVTSWTEIKGVQPLVLISEYDELSALVKADRRWQDAMRTRGFDNFDEIQIDGWAAGQVPAAHRGSRLLRAVSYFKGQQTNFYGRPIEGVTALVNMNTGQVIEVNDSGIVPLAPPSQELDEKSTGRREAPRALTITQPDGASFTVNGQEIRWQKWRFRYTMHPREGVVLHTVAYEDDGRVRPILYRASLSEMVVPYADPDRNWRWRSAFDVGEYSVGRLASSIEPKTDAPAYATLLDATFADDDGAPYVLERAVGIYERDGGMLWKHYEGYSKTNESRRARQLVVFFIATIGNYDYALNWVFHQDGTIEADAALSGIMLPKGVKDAKVTHAGLASTGHLVSANIVAPHHQHFFNFRLDFDVDGTSNAVHEMNTRAMAAGPANPALNGMVMHETRLDRELIAKRQLSLQTARHWLVLNPTAQTALGHHPSYILVPGVNSVPYVAPASEVRRRAGFLNHHFWATRYNPDELSAAGAYPNQSTGGDGLPKWISNDESLVNQDVVVWYTMGVTHIPRPEEWPIMPVTHVGFKMIPGGFFVRNPALDVPKDK